MSICVHLKKHLINASWLVVSVLTSIEKNLSDCLVDAKDKDERT